MHSVRYTQTLSRSGIAVGQSAQGSNSRCDPRVPDYVDGMGSKPLTRHSQDGSGVVMMERLLEMLPRLLVAHQRASAMVVPAISKLKAEPAGRGHRRHHYVPQFWLKKFADGEMLCVVDPSGEQPPRCGDAGDEAFVRDLYATYAEPRSDDSPSKKEASVLWEHVVAVFENRAAPPFTRLIECRDGSTPILSDLERYWISVLVTLQFVRVPSHFNAVRSSEDAVAQKFAMSLASLGPPREWMTDDECRKAGIDPADLEDLDWTPASFGPDGEFAVSIDRLTDVPSMLEHAFDPSIVSLVFSRTWSVIKFPDGGLTLPLRDGVYLRAGNAGSLYGSPGLGSAEEIWVPMSPDTLLVMHWRDNNWEPRGWTAEACVAYLGRPGGHQACHPDHAERATATWTVCRNSDRGLSALTQDSGNIGVPHLVE